ncbi:hypothetical protein ACJI9D_003041 [Listeria monocytogenes]|nr:hypothetical protein [Listeria monocytogenes]RKC26288.1 hypothetical protein EC36_03051 [Listeria monocytogenes]
MTTKVKKHMRKAHLVKAHYRQGRWISSYMMPECEISEHERQV